MNRATQTQALLLSWSNWLLKGVGVDASQVSPKKIAGWRRVI
jgi:hypothetical protein